jgi:hypothetical protein
MRCNGEEFSNKVGIVVSTLMQREDEESIREIWINGGVYAVDIDAKAEDGSQGCMICNL